MRDLVPSEELFVMLPLQVLWLWNFEDFSQRFGVSFTFFTFCETISVFLRRRCVMSAFHC